jgi:hypothetical protein
MGQRAGVNDVDLITTMAQGKGGRDAKDSRPNNQHIREIPIHDHQSNPFL